MSLLDIRRAGDPVLKEVCQPVQKIDKQLKKLLDDMADTMYKNDGVGLAAPQVGKLIRAVVIDCQDEVGLIELINPKITYREGKAVDTEGCLSVPDIFGEVERAAKVKVEFLNRRGKLQHLTAKGLLARCIQHECDHLEGQLFIDIAQSIHRGQDK
ncbi:MAG TPA: peptide deformylase [Selenomonas sp.]|jgi:peptide deformylase|nr:peptide deformylase [Selenomonadaceae bacterium]MDD6119992.1 peptide deformylase [Selenomonadaceae bacterium]MDD7055244.1 peptide deformylase [Selenomonadaceae bacterium]MDY3916199.1 peptide deformylase [Selenomonadaceae bacterium]HBT79838.1 peptide deformylase [Selenomonas sp.]